MRSQIRTPVASTTWWPALQSAAAGCCGAASAVFGKAPAALGLGLLGRLFCYAALFAFNAALTALYIRSLTQLPSLAATVYSNAANIIATGLLGWWLYGEPLGTRWVYGVACIIVGLLLITAAASPQKHTAAAAARVAAAGSGGPAGSKQD